MASETALGVENEGERGTQRYSETKVYTRKAFKGPKKKEINVSNKEGVNSSINDASTVVATAETTAKENKSGSISENNEKNNQDGRTKNNNLVRNTDSVAAPLEDTNQSHKHPVSHVDTNNVGSDDSCSPNQLHVVAVGNGPVMGSSEDPAKINLVSSSKQDMRIMKRKLEEELDLVRKMVKRFEEKELQIRGVSNSVVFPSNGVDNGLRRVQSDVASAVVPPHQPVRLSMPLNQLRVSVLENNQVMAENYEKEKRTPKANQFYRNSEFLLAKDKFPPESNKKSKLNGKRHGGGEAAHWFGPNSKFFKSCNSLLDRLMKHKHGWVFNTPVDVKGLGLHDYLTIIRYPMDLGTVKSRLIKNWYKSPREFAEDVRLTFRNAMIYNPKGQDVHVMAEQLLKVFEDRWIVIETDFIREMGYDAEYEPNLRIPASRHTTSMLPPTLDVRRNLDRYSVDRVSRPISVPPMRTPAPKKPKAKDLNKRDMTYEEKQKLSTNLQSLPSEKLDSIVQIIKKRNSSLFQRDDEIEVDIDSVDTETLWELDRFVTNYKKSLSKHKRRAELALQARAEAALVVPEKAPVPPTVQMPEESRVVETTVPPAPVEINRQGENASRSSSSSSSSSDSGSSSSDSDSESSSASGSDAGGSPRS